MATQKAKFQLFQRLEDLGFTYDEAVSLRRIEMTLQRRAERECDDGGDWAIERCEECPAFELINWPCASGNVWLVENRGTTASPLYNPLREFQTKDLTYLDARLALRRERDKYIAGRPYNVYHGEGKARRYPIADREAGALKRLTVIVGNRNTRQERHCSCDYVGPCTTCPKCVKPTVTGGEEVFAYHQTDCRGCMLYLITRAQLGSDKIDQVYTRGLAVCA